MLQKIETAPLRHCRQLASARWKEIGDRRLVGGRLEHGPLMHCGQEAGPPVHDTTRWQAARVGQHDERGQVVTLTPQTISHPRAHARESEPDEAAVHHEHRGTVQRRLALHRMNERHVIDARGQLRQQVTHPAAALTVLPELPVARLTVAGLRGKEGQLAVGIERLPGVLMNQSKRPLSCSSHPTPVGADTVPEPMLHDDNSPAIREIAGPAFASRLAAGPLPLG